MRKRTVKLWRLNEDGRKLFAGEIEAADPRELVLNWSAFLATAERGTYFATYRGSFVGPEPALENQGDDGPPSASGIRGRRRRPKSYHQRLPKALRNINSGKLPGAKTTESKEQT